MQTASRKDLTPVSSWTLQKLLSIDFTYTFIFFTVMYLLYVAKGYGLYYPSGKLVREVVILTIFYAYELYRKDTGKIGNKTETPSKTWIFIGLSILSIPAYIFFLALQRYVLLIEVILSIAGLGLVILELLFAIFAIRNFKSY